MPELADNVTEPLNDVERAIEYLLAQRIEVVRDILGAAGLPKSGRKEELRKRLLTGLANDQISADDLVSRLDEIEGWGNQHILLFNSTESLAAKWQDKGHVEKQLQAADLSLLLNRPRQNVA